MFECTNVTVNANKKQANRTGIPNTVKERFENKSGFSFDDVRIHYNSDKPAQLQALAYTQGNQVYIAPGQERCLGHELGHVVQQKRGGVRPTVRYNGVGINDDEGLEREAEGMGGGAVQLLTGPSLNVGKRSFEKVVQCCSRCGDDRCKGECCLLDDPIPKELEHFGSSMATTCVVSIIGVNDYVFRNGGGLHAEEHAIKFLEYMAYSNKLGKGSCQVVFSISKSPCSSTSTPRTRTDGKPGCMELIQQFNGSTINGVTFHVTLAATKAYCPHIVGGKAASRRTYAQSGVPSFLFVRGKK